MICAHDEESSLEGRSEWAGSAERVHVASQSIREAEEREDTLARP